MSPTLISARSLCKVYEQKRMVLDHVSLDLMQGEMVALVGRSGCGKSTLGQVLLRLQEASSGQVFFQGIETTKLSKRRMFALREHMQIVFQDPYTSLNPKMRVDKILQEPLWVHKKVATQGEASLQVRGLLESVELDASYLLRYPHELSGGQRQRVALARALALKPRFLVCDEVTASLDVCLRRQMVDLLLRLQRSLQMTYLFISHDIPLVEKIADRIVVMHEGAILSSPTSNPTSRGG